MAFEQYIIPEDQEHDPKISVNLFMALIGEYIRGYLTSSQVKSRIEEYLSAHQPEPVTLTTNSETDIDNLLSAIDGATTITEKLIVILTYRDVFDIAENSRVSLYGTQTELRARLNLTELD